MQYLFIWSFNFNPTWKQHQKSSESKTQSRSSIYGSLQTTERVVSKKIKHIKLIYLFNQTGSHVQSYAGLFQNVLYEASVCVEKHWLAWVFRNSRLWKIVIKRYNLIFQVAKEQRMKQFHFSKQNEWMSVIAEFGELRPKLPDHNWIIKINCLKSTLL